MKKILCNILLILALAFSECTADKIELARMGAVYAGAGTAGCAGDCTTVGVSETGINSFYDIGRWDASWKAWKFTGDGTSLCKIRLYIGKVGTTANTLTVCVYNDNGGVPGSQVGNCSAVVPISSLETYTDGCQYTFTGLCAPVANGVPYWIVIKPSAYDSSNHARQSLDTSCAVQARTDSTDGGANWSAVVTTSCASLALYY